MLSCNPRCERELLPLSAPLCPTFIPSEVSELKYFLLARAEEKILLPQLNVVPVEPELGGTKHREGSLKCKSTGYQLGKPEAG